MERKTTEYNLKPNSIFFKMSYFFIIICIVLNSFRYFFQFNSSGTSPTYSDTPLWFVISKYSILFTFSLFLLAYRRKNTYFNINFIFLVLFFSYLLFINIINYIQYDYIGDDLKILFLFIFFNVYSLPNTRIEEIKINLERCIYFMTYFITLSNLIVITSYFVFHRLPALAYDGGLVRFAGFLDDPNGVGMLCSFLSIYLFYNKKYLLFFIISLNLLLTISFSSYIVFFIFIIIISISNNNSFKLLLLILILFGALFGFFNIDYLYYIYEQKIGSINAHIEMDFHILSGIYKPLVMHESWLLSCIFEYFPVSIVFIFILANITTCFFMSLKNGLDFISMYILMFVAGNLFIPYVYTFPNNFLFFIFLAVYFRKRNFVCH